MCKRSKLASPSPEPEPVPQQQRQEEAEAEEAPAGVMASRLVLKSGVVRRYSAGERRERIERYRSKRNRRNYQKKITYACRKTLAENRKRIGGRFAQTIDEKPCLPEKTDQTPSGNTGSVVPEWWPAMEKAMDREEEEDTITNLLQWDWDWEMLATYLGFDLCSTTDPSIDPST